MRVKCFFLLAPVKRLGNPKGIGYSFFGLPEGPATIEGSYKRSAMAKSKHPLLKELDREIHQSIKRHLNYFDLPVRPQSAGRPNRAAGRQRDVPHGHVPRRWWQRKMRLVMILLVVALGIAAIAYLNLLINSQLG